MSPRMGAAISRRQLIVPIVATTTAALLSRRSNASASTPTQRDQVTNWVSRHAVPLRTVDPTARLADLAPLHRSIGDAQIVGLGESVHGASEEETLKHRTLRFLVERMGFRSIAWEEQWTVGVQVDDYIRTGTGDLPSLLAQLGGQWQTSEVADVLPWLRAFNAGRDDKVSFVGMEYYFTGPLAYDAVKSYVSRTAPDRLSELLRYLCPITPDSANPTDHVIWYEGVDDQKPFIRDAKRVYEIVAGLPHRPGDRDHALALHNARQILSFFVHYHLSDADALVYRDARAAENVRWWRDFTDDKIAYWAANPHTANAAQLRMVNGPGDEMRFASAGSYLRRWYGPRYVSIGYTFDNGSVSSFEPGKAIPMPPAKPEWFERPLGDVEHEQFAIDLRTPAPASVRSWENAPIVTRGLPQGGTVGFMDGGTLARWFDLVIHRQHVSPVRLLSTPTG